MKILKVLNPFIFLWNLFKSMAALGGPDIGPRMPYDSKTDDTKYF